LQVCSVIHPKQHKETKNRSARPFCKAVSAAAEDSVSQV
jgi:hypothetical protein